MDHKNYIRLNLENVADFPKMLTDKAKEFYNIDISKLYISMFFSKIIVNSHSHPFDGIRNWDRNPKLPLGYPGWCGRISAFVNMKSESYASAADTLFSSEYGKFLGFHTGTGSTGHTNGTLKMEVDFSFFVNDFPLLKNKYERYLIETAKDENNNISHKNLEISATDYAMYQSDVISYKKEIDMLNTLLINTIEHYKSDYRNKNPIKLEENSPDYKNLCENFNRIGNYVIEINMSTTPSLKA